MTAGVPGLGLGGLFALLAALCLPLLRSGPRARSGRLFAMALLISAAAVVAWQSLAWLYTAYSSGDAGTSLPRAGGSGSGAGSGAGAGSAVVSGSGLTHPVLGQLFGVPVILISLALMALLLLAGEVLFRVLGVRPTPLPTPIPPPPGTALSVCGNGYGVELDASRGRDEPAELTVRR